MYITHNFVSVNYFKAYLFSSTQTRLSPPHNALRVPLLHIYSYISQLLTNIPVEQRTNNRLGFFCQQCYFLLIISPMTYDSYTLRNSHALMILHAYLQIGFLTQTVN